MTRILKSTFLALCSVVVLASCSDAEEPPVDPPCNTFCEKVGQCGAPTDGCASDCQQDAQAASEISADCRAAFDGVFTCVGGLTCAQLEDFDVMGGTECSPEIAGCNAACGQDACSIDPGLSQ